MTTAKQIQEALSSFDEVTVTSRTGIFTLRKAFIYRTGKRLSHFVDDLKTVLLSKGINIDVLGSDEEVKKATYFWVVKFTLSDV